MTIPIAMAILIIAVATALREHRAASMLERAVAEASGGLRDPRTGLGGQHALQFRLEPELEWAQHRGQPYCLATLTVWARDPARCTVELLRVKRAHEHAFALRYNQFLIGLWDTAPAEAVQAVSRLGGAIAGSAWKVEATLVEIGVDGINVEELIEASRGTRLSLDNFAKATSQAMAEALVFRMRRLRTGRPWWRIAAALESSQRMIALSLMLLLLAYLVAPALPVAAPAVQVYWLLEVLFVPLIVLLLWSLQAMADAGRALLLISAALMSFVAFVDLDIANPGKLVVAALIGIWIAPTIERLDFVAPTVVVASGLDIWSVFSGSGTTRRLVEEKGWLFHAGAVDAPFLAGQQLFVTGMLDIVFASLFLALARYWEMSQVRTAVAVFVGLSLPSLAWFVDADMTIPAIPSLALCFLVANWRPLLSEPLRTLRQV